MPLHHARRSLHHARRLTSPDRTAQADLHLGVWLAFVAGATNAGGFLAVHQYTSHMTGIVSSIADNLTLGAYDLVGSALGALLSFLGGAACCAVMVNFARQRRMSGLYAYPLLLEATLLLLFGLLGATLASIRGLFVPLTVMLLCFIMGLQNAVISKLSKASIRTTHITGIVTDIGIELGKLLYRNAASTPAAECVSADKPRLWMLTWLASSFLLGGLVGAIGFKHLGYVSTVPLALLLVTLAVVPAMDDVLEACRRWWLGASHH